jgi:hypothetical protein
MHTIFYLETLQGRDHLEYLSVDWKIILECMIGKYDRKVWTGYVWLRIETNDGLL